MIRSRRGQSTSEGSGRQVFVPPAPALLVLISGVMQAVMLPMLAVAAIFFRYRRCDRSVTPGLLWDLLLWLSALGMLIAGVWAAWENLVKYFGNR